MTSSAGTAASAIQPSRSLQVGSAAAVAWVAPTTAGPRAAIRLAAATSKANPAKPSDQTQAWIRSGSMGSIRNG